jgi:hypothetical protein
MTLPKGIRKLSGVVLLSAFLFLISPLPILASDNSLPNQEPRVDTRSPSRNYQIEPLPSPSGDEKVTPIPTPNEGYSVQQANIFEDIGNALEGFAGGLLGFLGDAAGKAVSAALYIIEHALVLQIGGKVVTGVVDLIAAGDVEGAQQLVLDFKNSPNPADGGLIGIAGNTTDTLLAMPLPISSGQYFASINPFKEARAQIGEGQEGLGGPDMIILELWTKVRNVSYILAVVALVIIGFMIMLRIPLGPRTVVSAQNSLPRIALALFLITFSYAISGLLIDLTRMVADILNAMIAIPYDAIWYSLIGTVVAAILGAVLGGMAFGLLGGVIILLLALILCIITFVTLLYIIFKLLTRYVIFLLLTIFAPFFFLFGALPGMEGIIFTWFKRAAAALLAIPVTGLVLNLAFAIGFSGFGNFPVVDMNLLGGDLGQIFGWVGLAPIVGFGLFFFATKVPDMIDQVFNIKPAPRGGLGPGSFFVTPFMTAGQAGRSIGGLQTARTGAITAGGWLGQRGWGKRPPATPTPGGGEIQGPAPAAEGRGARFARFAKQYTPLRYFGERQWKEQRSTAEELEKRKRIAERGATEVKGTTDPEGPMEH